MCFGTPEKKVMRTENLEPSYWAVIPAQIRYAPDLPAGAKLLYAEISSLTDARGYCFASNRYFAELYGIGIRTVQRYLDALKNAGMIRIADGDGGTEQRKIFAGVNPLADPHDKNDTGGDKSVTAPMTEMSPPNNVLNKKEEQNPPISPEKGKAPMPAALMQRVADYARGDVELEARFVEFAENRRAIKKPIKTDRTLTLLLSKLNELSHGNRDRKLQLIDLAIERNWLSFFPLHDDRAIRLPREAKSAAPSYEPEVSAWQ